MKRIFHMAVLAAVISASACKDSGSAPPLSPGITMVLPATAAPGDTIRILGVRFGAVQSGSSLRIGQIPFTQFPFWSETEVRSIVPAGAVSAGIVMTVAGRSSTAVAYSIIGTPVGMLSFGSDIQPILNTGCALSGCHRPPGPSSGFDQSNYAGLRAGGVRFGTNVILPGDSANSEIIRAMRGTASVSRMPLGGPWASAGVPDSLIRTVATWIQQGAQNN
jgi:hypothetical protein